MKQHKFTLILSGISELTPEIGDAVYKATGGDIELSMRDGIASLDFNRGAATLREAVTSAIHDVERADMGLRVIRVESVAANTIAKINAELLGATSSP